MFLPKVAIIVLNFNGKDCLLDCLASLRALQYEEKEVIVVDNGSTDGSFEEAQSRFPEYTFVATHSNLGFAGGMNRGIEEARKREAKWYWLFNYDATTEPSALQTLIETTKDFPRCGLASPLIFEKDTQKIWFAKGRINFLRMRVEHILPSHSEQAQKAYSSDFLTGCALLIKKEVIDSLGFLDEKYFLYYEDADLSLRTQKAGFETLVMPQAHVFHAEKSQSSPTKLYFLVLSGLLFFQKYTPAVLRPYVAIYATIRRIKNRFDMLLGREPAYRVHEAYSNFYGHASTSFPRHR